MRLSKSELACGDDQIARQFVRLHAVNRFLHLGLEILNAHAQAVEAEAAQGFQVRAIGDARINFDADFRIRREGKSLARVAEKIFHLRGSQIGGRSAAPVKLNHRTILRYALAHVLDFAFQGVQVGNRDFFIFLNRNIAGAEQDRGSRRTECACRAKAAWLLSRRARKNFPDRRGRNHLSTRARWDSWCSAGPGRLYFSRVASVIWAISNWSVGFIFTSAVALPAAKRSRRAPERARIFPPRQRLWRFPPESRAGFRAPDSRCGPGLRFFPRRLARLRARPFRGLAIS